MILYLQFLPWYLDFLFSAPFWITSPNSFMLQPPFTISAPTIILWHSYSLLSLVSLLPTPPPLFCLKLLIGLFLHSHHPLFHFISPVCYQLHSRLLLFNFIIVIYIHRGYCFMFCYFYLVFYVVKQALDRTLYTFWYYYYYYYVNNKNNNGTLLSEFSTCITLCMKGVKINVRESWRGNREWIIQRNWQQGAHKTLNEEKTKTKQTKHNYRDSYRPLH